MHIRSFKRTAVISNPRLGARISFRQQRNIGYASDAFKSAHAFTGIGFTELDFLVKVIRLIIEGKKHPSLEYNSLASTFGIAAANIGL